MKAKLNGGEHPVGEAQSAIESQWFCDELGAGGRCRGHPLFYPYVGM